MRELGLQGRLGARKRQTPARQRAVFPRPCLPESRTDVSPGAQLKVDPSLSFRKTLSTQHDGARRGR